MCIAPNAKCQRVLVLALRLVLQGSGSYPNKDTPLKPYAKLGTAIFTVRRAVDAIGVCLSACPSQADVFYQNS